MNIQTIVAHAKQKMSHIGINHKQAIVASTIASALIIGSTGAAFAFDDGADRKNSQDDHYKMTKSTIQYTGPVATTTIADMLEQQSWFDDQKFTLEGHIIKQISPKTYVFSDGTDEIEIELKAKQAVSFSDKDMVRISGEYERELFENDQFEVKTLTVL
ncbi:YgiW/YdeI family stress tolerance OB fold protein [Vibrio intestinalis]|uniref:YgiW/YdeI family stress tolerance OB fold protein n=1 Tax=Vibrio intestinalis TaxID=2933291 RepID=UPI0021A3AF3D|nr:NirD/YgiW/YdeI family stress tolerance protein [Vibrio intestinalis]